MEDGIESKVTFLDVGEGKRIPFRSRLEARWAEFFTQCGLKWHYEPKTFRLPSGLPYTPDFLVDKVGWFEIKPTMEKLYEGGAKIIEFGKSAELLLGSETEKHFFVCAATYPCMEDIMLFYAPQKEVALVSRFRMASCLRELSFASYKKAVERAEDKAEAFRQEEVSMQELIFTFRHKECSASFKKLAKDYNGEEEFPITVKEIERGYANQRAKPPAKRRKLNLHD